MYQLVSAIARSNTAGARWASLDIGPIQLGDLSSQYEKVYAVLTNPFYTGETANPPFSKTSDFALRYSIPGGIVYGEIRRYFTDNIGSLINMENRGDISNIWRNLGYTSGPDTYDFQANNYRDINDRDLTGTEFDYRKSPGLQSGRNG